MRTARLLAAATVLTLLLCGPAFAQSVPAAAVPFITQVTPPSLPPGTDPNIPSTFTLTILGANFTPNDTVNLAPSPSYVLHPANITVNPSGSQITAQFINTVLGSPSTLAVTVSNPAGTPPSTSNTYYLPFTPAQPTVVLNQSTNTSLPGTPKAIVAADFFGNGSPGIAVVSQNSNTLSIYSASFGSPFTFSSSYPTGNQPWGIVAAPLLGTNLPDLAVTNSIDNTVTVLFANGGGTYRLGTVIPLPGVFPTQIVAGDFNGDGKIDLAVLNTCGTSGLCYPRAVPQGPGTVTILLNNGDGTFTVSSSVLTTGNIPFAMATADLNGDGNLDLIVANQKDDTLSLFMGNGDGTFSPAIASPATGDAPTAIAVGDFNGDGNLDLAVTNSSGMPISILLNQNCPSVPAISCRFALAPVAPVAGSQLSAISTADLNADGFLDLIVADYASNSISILLGDGTGAFNLVAPQGPFNFSTGPGPQSIALADFNDDGRLDIVTANSTGSFTFLRQAAVPQLSLTTSNSSPVYGMFLNFTVNFTPPFNQPTPTGTLTFFDGSTNLGSIPINGYQTYFEYQNLNAGSHQITAVYSGDSNFTSATSNAVSEAVSQASVYITLNSDVNTVSYVQPFTLTATLQPQISGNATGIVSFFDNTSGTNLGSATILNNSAQLTLSKLSPGAHPILAIYQGDTNFTGGTSASYTENIIQASTTVAITSSPNPIALGQSVTFAATVQPGSGNTATGGVAFFDGPTLIGFGNLSNNSAQFTTTSLSVGPHSITAQYTGDTNFSGSTSSNLVETVNPGPVNIVFGTNLNPSVYGMSINLTATVQPIGVNITPTGSIAFFDGANFLGGVTFNSGSVQFSTSALLAGTHTLTARYSGDANFQAATSSPISQNVSQAVTSTTVSAGQNPSSFAQPLTLTANIQPVNGGTASGTVTFFDGALSLGTATPTNNSAQLTLSTLSLGSHSITARYAGDANTLSSSSAAVTQTINPSPTTTTVTSNLNPSSYLQFVTFAATVKPAFGTLPPGQISFFDGSTLLGTVNMASGPSQVTLQTLVAGSHSITAQYLGGTNFAASTSTPLTQTVNPAASQLGISTSVNPSTFGQSVTINATISTTTNFTASNSGSLTFFDNGISLGTVNLPGNTNFAALTTTALSVGSHSITVSYTGDSNFVPGTSAAFAQTVNLEPSTTTIASSSYTPAFNQSITLTAVVHPQSGTSATGTITFLDRTTTLGTATISGNTAQFSISTLSAGAHYISAQYSGDSNTATSVSAQTLVTVSPPSTTTLLTSSVNPAVFNQPITFTATLQLTSTGTPTGTVTFYDGPNSIGTGTIASNSAQLTIPGSLGTHSITATYSGDPNFSGSTSSALSQIVNIAPTTTTVTSSSNPSTFGFNVTFTVNVTPQFGGTPNGIVTLYDGANSIGGASLTNQNGQNFALITLSTLTAGTHSITATYNGNSFFSVSTSTALTQTVNLPATTTILASNVNPAAYGQTLSLVATVQPPGSGNATGTVTFFDGSTSLGTAAVSNNLAQLSVPTLSVGSHPLTAQYSGDSKFAASTSAPVNEIVNVSQTTTTVSPNINPAFFGQSITITAIVQGSAGGSPTGTVTFFDGATSLGSASVSTNIAQLSVSSFSVGTHSLTVKYAGDANFSASTSSAVTETINQAYTSIAVSTNPTPTSFGQTVIFTAAVQPAFAGAPTGTVTFFDAGVSLGSSNLSAGSAQLALSNLSIGSHSITARYNGDTNFTSSTSSSIAQTVAQSASATFVSSSLNPSSYGQSVTFTAAVNPAFSGAPTGTVTFFDGSTSLGNSTVSGGVATLTTAATALLAGSHSISARYNGDSNFLTSASSTLAQVVNPAATSTTLTSSSNPSAAGKSITFTANVSSSLSGPLNGTVNFYVDGGATPFSSSALSSGSAHFSTNSLTAGFHTLVAAFVSSNSNFAGSTSAPLNQAITDFTISASPASNTISRGTSGTYTVTVTPEGGLTGNISLTCSGLPGGTSCSISPSTLTLDGTNPSQATATITVAHNAGTGTHTFTFKGTSSAANHSATVTLIIK